MEDSIEIKKSICNKKLIYGLKGFALINYILSYLVYILIIGISLFISVTAFFQEEIIFACLMILVAAWMVSNFVLVNKLTKISGLGINENRALIIRILNLYYDDLNLKDYGQMLVREIKYGGFLSSRRCITIIFNNNDLYINIQSLRWSNPSPFHGLVNFLRCQDIKKQF